MSQLPPPPSWYYDEAAESRSGNPSNSEAQLGGYIPMNHNIRDSTNTTLQTSSPWVPLHHPQATMPVPLPHPDSYISLPGPDTLHSSSRYELPATIHPRNVRTPQQRKIRLKLWETNKDEMKRFYMDEDHTLPELIKHMETLEFKIKATYVFSSYPLLVTI